MRIAISFLLMCLVAFATGDKGEILTNAVHTTHAPPWITSTRLNKTADYIQSKMEWDTHRVELIWYTDEAAFERAHHLGPSVMSFSRKQDNTIHMGPKITEQNFDGFFGHELVHIISWQKYKGAIPRWLEEGLANYYGHNNKVDYQILAEGGPLKDVTELTHPYGSTESAVHFRYMASQALAEMLAAKCDLTNLLRLSVGRKMEDYLSTYCKIDNVTKAYNDWVALKMPNLGTEGRAKVTKASQ